VLLSSWTLLLIWRRTRTREDWGWLAQTSMKDSQIYLTGLSCQHRWKALLDVCISAPSALSIGIRLKFEWQVDKNFVPRLCSLYLHTSVRLFWISSQMKSFLSTPNVENKVWSSYETLESTVEMKLLMNFHLCLQFTQFLLNFEIWIPIGIWVWCYFR